MRQISGIESPVGPERHIFRYIGSFFLAMLVPSAMIGLAILVFSSRDLPEPRQNAPIYLIFLDPLPSGSFRQIIGEDRLPAFEALQTRGVLGTIADREVRDEIAARMQLVTGKDSVDILGAGIRLDPTTRTPCPRSIHAGVRTATLQEIARWNHRPVYIGESSDADSLTHNGLHIMEWCRGETSVAIYLTDCNSKLAAIQSRIPEKAVMAVVCPGELRKASHVFRLNAWLAQQGFLSFDGSGGIDWSKTSAFGVNQGEYGIRINRNSLYPGAPVSDTGFRDVRRSVAASLKVFCPGNDEIPLCRTLMHGQERYPERLDGDYPDIEFAPRDPWTDLAIDVRNPSACEGSECLTANNSDETVVFSADGGFLILSGPPFQKNRQFGTGAPGAHPNRFHNTDLTPTLLFVMDLPIGRDMTGRVLRPILSNEWEANPIRFITTHDRIDPRVSQPRFDDLAAGQGEGDVRGN